MQPPIVETRNPLPSPSPSANDVRPHGLHLVVIGAGLAGLAAALSTKLANLAHRVTICEAVRELQEIGAGLQITPNGTRLLSHWGLTPELASLAAVPKSLSVHRYDGTKLLAHEPDLQGQMASRYGHPFWDLHRVDLQKAMVKRCTALGISIQLNSRAVSVDFESALVTLHDGRRVQGDVVLLADGLWSSIRPQFLGQPSPAVLTGDLAYRITIHIDDIPLDHPDRDELIAFIQNPTVNFWIGPHAHAVSYSVSSAPTTTTTTTTSSSSPNPSESEPKPTILNIVLLLPDDLPPSINKLETSPAAVQQIFSTWSPLLQKFISTLTTTSPSPSTSNSPTRRTIHKWKLLWLDSSTLPTWTSPSGTFFIAGDACHPMLPYLAQGANSSLEDGAVLGHLLGKVTSPTSSREGQEQLRRVATTYQGLRMERGRRIQAESFRQRDDFHMVDGEEQEERDRLMVGMLEGGKGVEAPFPSRWTCPEVQGFLYGYDAYGEAERAWREGGEVVDGST